jgi:hypothetical protein
VDGAQEIVAEAGAYYVTGTLLGNTLDGYVMRINPADGVPRWTKKIGGDNTEEVLQSIAAFSDGILVGGYRIRTIGEVITPAPWLLKLDRASGDRLWELTFTEGQIPRAGVKDLVAVEEEHILAVGIDTSDSEASIWAAKVHASGAVRWVKRWRVQGEWLEGRAGAYVPGGNYAIGGFHSDTSDPGDALILEVRPDGRLVSAARILKGGTQQVESAAVLRNGRIAMVGYGDEAAAPGLLSWNVWVCGSDGSGTGCGSRAVTLSIASAAGPAATTTPMESLSVSVQAVTGDQTVSAPATDLCAAQGSGGDSALGIGGPSKG